VSAPDADVVLMCTVGGRIGTETKAELQITAMSSTPEHIKEFLVADGIKRVQREFPSAENVKLREDWAEFEIVSAEDQGEDPLACTRCPHPSHPGRECGAPMYGMTCYCGRTT
jgi:hypothetical protein